MPSSCGRTTPRPWFTLGTLYRMEGELDNAAQALLKVTKLQPDDASAHANLGAIYGRQKKWNEAITELGER